ncbi:MAG TPA: hypothetical protein VGL66_00540 [Caulobacteraceae bacterium]|jgi:hypothetical protein
MKRILFAAAAIAALGMSTHAFAQTATGTITVTGTVTGSCSVVTGGSGNAFGGTIALGELDDTTTGYLQTGLEGATPVSGATQSFQINCNSGNPTVALSATRLSTTGSSTGGYSANIDYTADVTAAKAGGGTTLYHYTTAASLPVASSGQLGDRLANTPANIVVDARSFAAENGATSILDAGSWSSTITVVISPTS